MGYIASSSAFFTKKYFFNEYYYGLYKIQFNPKIKLEIISSSQTMIAYAEHDPRASYKR